LNNTGSHESKGEFEDLDEYDPESNNRTNSRAGNRLLSEHELWKVPATASVEAGFVSFTANHSTGTETWACVYSDVSHTDVLFRGNKHVINK
jgi:hypothetical protein